MAPQTLRQVAGLPEQPTALRDAALVLIDCQNTYREGIMRLVGVEEAVAEAARLLRRARDAGIPIIHIQHDSGPGSPYDVSARIGRISDEVAPGAGEPVIIKHYPNSFIETDLEQRLRSQSALYQKRIEAAAGRQSDLTELSRDYQTLQGMYQSLLAKKEDSKVAANLERRQIGEQFKILDPARLPERPTSPNRQQLQSMGLMAGLGVGVVLMGLIEYLDKTLKSEGDVTAALNLLVLATVPLLPELGYRVARRRKILAMSATVLLTAVVGAAALAWRAWK